jgi:glycosyltransferase involved in cell wall biosynthesis
MSELSEIKSGGLRSKGVQRQSSPELPLVSIVTVVYNGAAHLEQAMQSVIGQSYANIEYLLIDGGSSDGTLEIVAKYQDRLDYWISEPDRGIYDAMNKGIALCRGELIALLNADDYYQPDAVEAVVESYRRQPSAQILYGHAFFIDDALKLRYRSRAHADYWRGMCFSHQAMFVQRDLYLALGSYDAGLRIAADYDFVVKCFTRGIAFTEVDAFLVNYRDSGLSAQDRIASMREGRRVLRRYLSACSRQHLVYLCLLGKSLFLSQVLKMIKASCGAPTAARLSAWYLRAFIAREREPWL